MLQIYLNIQLQYVLTHLHATYKIHMKKTHLWIAANQALLVSASVGALLVLVPGRYPATCQEASQLSRSWDLWSLVHSTNLHIHLVKIRKLMSTTSINMSFFCCNCDTIILGHNHLQMSTADVLLCYVLHIIIYQIFLPASHFVYCYKVLGEGLGKSWQHNKDHEMKQFTGFVIVTTKHSLISWLRNTSEGC